MIYLRRQQSNTWKAHLVNIRNFELQFCNIYDILPAILYQITSRDRVEIELSEKLCDLLQFTDAAPLGLSQLYEAQQIATSRQSLLRYRRLAMQLFSSGGNYPYFTEEWLRLKVRIFPTYLKKHVRQARAPLSFKQNCPTPAQGCDIVR